MLARVGGLDDGLPKTGRNNVGMTQWDNGEFGSIDEIGSVEEFDSRGRR